jgi:hypothetical protein
MGYYDLMLRESRHSAYSFLCTPLILLAGA